VNNVTDDFDPWYRATRDVVYRAMVAATGEPEAAADLTAEAFARALERWSVIRVHPAPLAWLLRVGTNLHRSRWRRWQHELAHRQHLKPAHWHDRPPFDPGLAELIRALPPRQRDVLALRVLLDVSTQQTADVLGIAPGTVTAHLHRALTTLRAAAPASIPTLGREGP
jgi:RNA polymerase sigma factor (sigma-70 family)